MPFDRRIPSAIVCLATSILASGPAHAQAPAAGQDAQLMQQGDALNGQGKYAEAAAVYEELIKKFPQVPSIPEAYFRAGYAHFLAGNFDPALASFKKIIDNKNLPPEMATLSEMALSMVPQILAAKTSKLAPEDPKRKPALEEVVKEFDVYLAKYPATDEAESANYGKALALYQLEKYDPSIEVLRANLTKFAASPTVQDSQYLLALTLATVASREMEKATPNVGAASAQYDESEKFLRDIIAKNQNVALINDAYFQIGELLLARGGFLSGDDNKQKQNEIFAKALESYRSVASKDRVVAAQKARIAFFKDLMTKAGIAKDMVNFQKYKRLVDKETERLAQVEGRTDQTETAQFKTGLIFFTQGKLDETRVLYTHMENVGTLENPDDKKQALYFVTMTYAMQNVIDKAVEKYNTFQATYKGDPVAQNLPLMIGAMYINAPKGKDPTKAIEYFNEGLQIYPKGKAFGSLVLMRAAAQIELKQFAAAETELIKVKGSNPDKAVAIDVDFYLGVAQVQTGKIAEAVATFKALRDKYPGTPQAETAHSQVGQLLASLDAKAALPELESFQKKYPESKEMPAVMMAEGKALATTGKTEDALKTFEKLAKSYPKSDAAPFSYFERGRLLAEQQKFDECLTAMTEFVTNYPDDPALFKAYDFMAQILGSSGKSDQAITKYNEFVAKRPKDTDTPEALLKLAGLWKGFTDSQGNYIVIDEAKRVEWKKGIQKTVETVEKLLTEFPEAAQVAQSLNYLMDVQRLQLAAKITTESDLEKYFKDLAQKFSGQPSTQSKILFTLASYTYTKDKAKAVEQMNTAYKPDLKYAPDDLDRYGDALIENKKIDEAIKVYEKLSSDYPLNGVAPKQAPRDIQEAQAIVSAGLGKAFQEKGDPASKEKAIKLFSDLETNYSWSPKMLAVQYGQAVALHEQKKDPEAMARIQDILRGKSSSDLRAQSMLLLGKIHEANNRFELAIDTYIKISVFYSGVPKVAAEGLWRGAQLIERQVSGEIPMPTPPPKAAAAPAKK